MIFKIFGAFTVIFVSFICGIFFSKREKFHLEDLRNFRNMFLLFLSETEYKNTPLFEIFYDISEKTSDTPQKLCLNVSKELKKEKISSDKIFSKVFLNIFPLTYLDEEDKKIILSFGKILRSDDKTQISNSINTILHFIESKEKEILKKSSENMKMYKSLGILGGILTAVLLI